MEHAAVWGDSLVEDVVVVGVLVAVLESVNFFIPGRTSKAISFASMIVTVVGLVLAVVFAAWASGLDGSFFIAVCGLVLSAVLLAMQVIGVTSKKITVSKSSDAE